MRYPNEPAYDKWVNDLNIAVKMLELIDEGKDCQEAFPSPEYRPMCNGTVPVTQVRSPVASGASYTHTVKWGKIPTGTLVAHKLGYIGSSDMTSALSKHGTLEEYDNGCRCETCKWSYGLRETGIAEALINQGILSKSTARNMVSMDIDHDINDNVSITRRTRHKPRVGTNSAGPR